MFKRILSAAMVILPCLLIAQNEGSYLGVSSNQLHDSKAEKLGFTTSGGAYLTSVTPGSPAARSGLKPFDYIFRIGEQNLNGHIGLGRALRSYQPGEIIPVSLIRNQQEIILNVPLGNRAAMLSSARPKSEDPFLGVHQTHDDPSRGVTVNIGENTTADYIGMQDGDVVVQIDDYPILDWHDLSAAINARNVGDPIEVRVNREGQEFILEGSIKSEDGHTTIDKKLDMEEMDVQLEAVGEDEMPEAEVLEEMMKNTVQDLSITSLNLFPNPNIGQFTITFDLPERGDVNIIILSAQGQQVVSENLSGFQGQFNRSFDLGNNAPGIYFLMIRQGRSVMTRKIIVTRS